MKDLLILQDNLRRDCENTEGQISVLAADLQTGEELFAYEPDRQMVSASLIKVPILLAALAQVLDGYWNLETVLHVPSEQLTGDSIAFEEGPRDCSLEELLAWMIINSDNTATNVLIDALTIEGIQRHIQELGLSDTRLARRMLDFAAIEQGRNNYTSARDMQRLFRALYAGEILNPELCQEALRILLRQNDHAKMRRYIWEDITVAHKSGSLPNLSHDAGVFHVGDRRVFFGAFVQQAPEEEGNPQFIGRLFWQVYHFCLNNTDHGLHS